jgi:hypothetical protein
MNLYSIFIGVLAAVILFFTFGVTVPAFCAGGIIVLVIISGISGYNGTRTTV